MNIKKILLNGNDWTVTGWWEHQWRLLTSMELGNKIYPANPPIPATVPGAVNADLLREELIPDPNVDMDSQMGEWVTNRDWIYTKKFSLPHEFIGNNYFLHFEGLDFWGEIWLNDVKISEFEGMMLPVQVEITNTLQLNTENELKVIFYRVPEVYGQYGYTSKIQHVKSRFNYIWDWCARIVPVGIWDDVFIEVTGNSKIFEFHPRTILMEDNASGEIELSLEISQKEEEPITLICELIHEGCKLGEWIWEGIQERNIRRKIDLSSVKAWWPNGYGEQPLYQIYVKILNQDNSESDSMTKEIGFKRVQLVQNQDAPKESLPYTLIVNGKQIFIQGVNWVPISPFYGTVSREDYQHYVGRFQAMNCNLLRVWGGAILERQDFYAMCDRMGLLVWQELFQSSSGLENRPSDDPDFLEKLRITAESAILRRRHHVSHVIWCGGNELLMEGISVPVDIHHLNIQMLNDLARELDPDKFFVPASPSGPIFVAAEDDFGKSVHHDVHGPWDYLGDEHHYRYYNNDDALFRSELGTPAISSMRTLQYISKKYALWPPTEKNPLWIHHGSWWIQWEALNQCFGAWDTSNADELLDYVLASQYLQAESLRFAVEAVQRRQPQASGVILWMGNEPFANTANTSLIEYNGRPKPAYGWLQKSFRPIHVSCKYSKIGYRCNETFIAETFLHDAIGVVNQLSVTSTLYTIRGEKIKEEQSGWNRTNSEHTIDSLGTINWQVENVEGDIFFLRIQAVDYSEQIYEDTYLFTVCGEHPFEPLRRLPNAEITSKWLLFPQNSLLEVHNCSTWVAVLVHVEEENPNEFAVITPNDLIILPGEKRVYRVEPMSDCVTKPASVYIHGMNVPSLFV